MGNQCQRNTDSRRRAFSFRIILHSLSRRNGLEDSYGTHPIDALVRTSSDPKFAFEFILNIFFIVDRSVVVHVFLPRFAIHWVVITEIFIGAFAHWNKTKLAP